MNKIKEQHEFQMLGFLGIFKESFKLIFTYPKIFFLITLLSILPQSCFILFVENWFSIHQFSNTHTLDLKEASSPWYNDIFVSTISKNLFSNLLIQAPGFIFSRICYLVSASTVVYTISCIYSDQEIAFKKVIKAVPKVWKPYMITYLSRYCATILASVLFLIWVATLYVTVSYYIHWWVIFVLIGVVCFLVGLYYMGIIWQLSDAISIIEKICGFEALRRSKALIKGKTGTNLAIFLAGVISSIPVYVVKQNHMKLMVGNNGAGVMAENYQKIVVIVWSSFLDLFFLVNQGVFYFVCKSYHHHHHHED